MTVPTPIAAAEEFITQPVTRRFIEQKRDGGWRVDIVTARPTSWQPAAFDGQSLPSYVKVGQ